jgi:hypothetical protein
MEAGFTAMRSWARCFALTAVLGLAISGLAKASPPAQLLAGVDGIAIAEPTSQRMIEPLADGRIHGTATALAKPTGLDDASWASLQHAVRETIGQQAKLTGDGSMAGAEGEAGDEFGYSVAVSGDTALIGARHDDVGNVLFDQGSAYVFTRNGGVWMKQAKLVAADGQASNEFGASVALSGDIALVGAPLDTVGGNIGQGSAYVFTRSDGVWTQQAQLTAGDGAANDNFGVSIALFGNTALVGASGDDVDSNFDQGSAYVFTLSAAAGTQQQKLTAADGAEGDGFGYSVAFSDDTVLVGAFRDDVGSNVDQGSAYVYVDIGGVWAQQAWLTAGDGAANDNFGVAVALSGDTALAGAHRDSVGPNSAQGSAYVYTRSGGVWTQQAILTADDGEAGDNFGVSVALFGDIALVGARLDDVGANADQGSAYVYARSGMVWTQQAKFTGGDGAAADSFGVPVALSGDTALVGAFVDDVGANVDQGSAYVFTRSGTAWTQQIKLVTGDGAAWSYFGYSVALSGDTALVGVYADDVGTNVDQGSAYVFVRNGTAWTQQAKLTAEDGAANDNFGISVALSGDTLLIGADGDDVAGNVDQGSAYVFVRSGGVWTQKAHLIAGDGAAYDHFGVSVALSGDTALVGAYFDTVGSNSRQGSAYVFARSGAAWTQQAQLTAADGARSDHFGVSVALSGDTALVGAYFDDVGASFNQGSAYVYTRNGMAWTQQAKLTAADGSTSDNFGGSVAVSGDTALVGAVLDTVGANSSQGSAYVYTRNGTVWGQQAKLTASGGESQWFGFSVALSGDTALVGAFLSSVGTNVYQGAAFLYTRTATLWTQQARLTAGDGVAYDRFGVSVALSGDTGLVGAHFANGLAPYGNPREGAAYLYFLRDPLFRNGFEEP